MLIKSNSLKDSTKQLYEAKLKKISASVGIPHSIESFSDHSEEIIDWIKDNDDKINTKRTYIKAVRAVLKYNGLDNSLYDDIYRDLENRKTLEYDFKDKVDAPTEMDKFYEILEKLPLDSTRDKIKYLVVALYTYIPPLRPMEYSLCKTGNINENKDNYYDGTKFIINNHKTYKTYGQKIIQIPEELKEIIDAFMEDVGTDYLIPNFSLKKNISAGKITDIIYRVSKKYLGISLNINDLRKMYVKYAYDNLDNDDIIKVSEIMGHSLHTQKLNYDVYKDE